MAREITVNSARMYAEYAESDPEAVKAALAACNVWANSLNGKMLTQVIAEAVREAHTRGLNGLPLVDQGAGSKTTTIRRRRK